MSTGTDSGTKSFFSRALWLAAADRIEHGQVPSMFEEKDLIAMFGMFDITGCGKISHTQVLLVVVVL